MFKILKSSENSVKLKDLKSFLIALVGLQNYQLYKLYKETHSEKELEEHFTAAKISNELKPEFYVKKYMEEKESKLQKENERNNKYYFVDENNDIFITLDKAKNIKRDFDFLNVNYRNFQPSSTPSASASKPQKNDYSFKPKINENSEKIYKKIKDKVYDKSIISNSNDPKGNMNHIERLLIHGKRVQIENQKNKEELEKKQLSECTFKPKINEKILKNQKDKEKDLEKEKQGLIKNQTKTPKERIEELYKYGKKCQKKRKDRTNNEIEVEKAKNELTFQPKILINLEVPETKFNNDIYNEKSYKLLYDRLKNGRMERLIREEAVNGRYGLTEEQKDFLKRVKESQNFYDFDYESRASNHQITTNESNLNTNENQRQETGTELTENQPQETGNGNENLEREGEYCEANGELNGEENDEGEVNGQNENENNEGNNDGCNNEENAENKINKEELGENLNEEAENNEGNSEEDLPDKREGIPLLIIDVNIRQGVKKKIYVYEGDTPEELAEAFAKEHHLEEETKNKLQNLIHNHMVRLLTRIDEENISSSDKK